MNGSWPGKMAVYLMHLSDANELCVYASLTVATDFVRLMLYEAMSTKRASTDSLSGGIGFVMVAFLLNES